MKDKIELSFYDMKDVEVLSKDKVGDLIPGCLYVEELVSQDGHGYPFVALVGEIHPRYGIMINNNTDKSTGPGLVELNIDDLYLRISEPLDWLELDQFIIEEMKDLYATTEE